MGIGELFIVALGLSADAFAVSLCKGLSMRKLDFKTAGLISFSFGIFQAGMPIIGYLLASRFSGYVESFDHWIAFALLALLGIKMLVDALKGGDDRNPRSCPSGIRAGELFLLSLATSIDALAVGITFAVLSVRISLAASVIGITTLVLSFCGIMIGHRFGIRFKKFAEIGGGLILILIGIKVLFDHMIFC
ncbi:MAG: manganese efflux pump [Clostridiaceae bacterium]|nr:manganese efflux pump MntP family protein [Oscillospiraceae bacterium]NLO62386.1 manganese efflux pump [Clostridiaceae bacterium]